MVSYMYGYYNTAQVQADYQVQIPNMQNMPRGGTFPVKRVFNHDGRVVRSWKLTLHSLSFVLLHSYHKTRLPLDEVSTGFDVHSYTAKVISDAGQPISRQDAKAHTFAPLYGASGFGRTQAEAAYYKQFTKKYSGIGKWHEALAKEALTLARYVHHLVVSLHSLMYNVDAIGGVTYFTQIKIILYNRLPLLTLYLYL